MLARPAPFVDFAARGLAARNQLGAGRRALLERLERAAAGAAIANPRNAGLANGITVIDNGATLPPQVSGATLQAFNGTNPVFRRIGGTHATAGARVALYSALVGATGGNFGSGDGKHVTTWRAAFMHEGRYVAFRVSPSPSAQRFLVNGKYVANDGTVLAATTGNTAQYILLDFGSRAVRRVEYEGQGTCALVGTYVEATARTYRPLEGRPRYAFLGESLIEGAGPAAKGDGIAPVMGDWLGADMTASGSGGTGWATTPAYRFDQRIANGDLSLGGVPDVICLTASGNDRTLSQPAIQANALAGLRAARALHPTTPIVVFGCPAGNTGPSQQVLDTEASVAAAVSAFNDPLCRFVPVSADPAGPWVSGTGYLGMPAGAGNSDWANMDGAHPSDEGAAAIGRRYARAALDALRAMLSA